MIKPSTLADEIYQVTFVPQHKTYGQWKQLDVLRRHLYVARRFNLDDRMSQFLGDLTTAAFIQKGRRSQRTLAEQLRMSARLPHATTWVEYNLYETLHRSQSLLGQELTVKDQVPEREGWLFRQLPGTDTIVAELFAANRQVLADGNTHWLFPWTYVWSVSDAPIAIPSAELASTLFNEAALPFGMSELVTGLTGYRTDKADAMACQYWDKKVIGQHALNLMTEWIGTMRRMWALLASINDIPVVTREVRASKGFVARGGYHRFLDHRTITLNVPVKKDLRVLARHVMALARRRAHMVRAHWRQDWRHMPAKQCQHEWTAEQTCKHCHGHRSWVHEHQRGDASLGVVMTDYDVRH